MVDNNEHTDESKMTTDRETIRRWADEHGATPARSRGGEAERSEYSLLPERSWSDDMESATWDEFFEDTEANDMTVLYNEHSTRDADRFEILGRDEAERRGVREVGSGGVDEMKGGGETPSMREGRDTDEMMETGDMQSGRGDMQSGRGTTDTGDMQSAREADEMMDDMEASREMTETGDMEGARETDEMMSGTEGGRGITESGDVGSDREVDETMGGETTETVDAERDAGTHGTDVGEETAETGGDVVGARGPAKGEPPESDTGPEGRSAPMEGDTGKTVVDASGNEVGMIVEVREGTAYVEPNPSLTSKIKTALGWGGADEENYPVRREQIARITDDRVELSSTERAR